MSHVTRMNESWRTHTNESCRIHDVRRKQNKRHIPKCVPTFRQTPSLKPWRVLWHVPRGVVCCSVCCSVLHCCCVVQCGGVMCAAWCSVLQCVAVFLAVCRVLQRVAVRCTVAVCCSVYGRVPWRVPCVGRVCEKRRFSSLSHYNTQQHTATHCNTLQHAITNDSLRQQKQLSRYIQTQTQCSPHELTLTICMHSFTCMCLYKLFFLCVWTQTIICFTARLLHTVTHCKTLQHAANSDESSNFPF